MPRRRKITGQSQVEEIKRYYSEWWGNPADIRNVVFEKLDEYVRRRIPQGRVKRALDIGSGHGSIISCLLEKGYDVTAIEFNEQFVEELERKFPSIKVIQEDALMFDFKEKYDLVTCIEFVPCFDKTQLSYFLKRLAKASRMLFINMSNRDSLHGRWVDFRGWRNGFIHTYAPGEFSLILERAGFGIVHRRGIGLITPVSLFKNFKGKLIPSTVSRVVNKLDPLFPDICHLYYVEAVSTVFKSQ